MTAKIITRLVRAAVPHLAVVAGLALGLALGLAPAAYAGGTQPAEKVSLPVVVNVLKGIGCTQEEVNTIIADAIARANKILKDAGVILTHSKTNHDVAGDGNADENAQVTPEEALKLRDAGLKEVTGEDANGQRRTGVKITISKKFTGFPTDEVDRKGNPVTVCPLGLAQVECVPWVGVAKSSDTLEHDEGETLAHELGHALGKLPDLYDDADCDRLMYGYGKPDSPLDTNEDERAKIKKGAKAFGGKTVAAGRNETAPKEPKPQGKGSATPSGDEPPSSKLKKRLLYANTHRPDAAGPLLLEIMFADSPAPAPEHYIHIAIDQDDDAATGSLGFEHLVTIQLLELPLVGAATWTALDGGDTVDVPASVAYTSMNTDIFTPGTVSPVLPLPELLLGLALDPAANGLDLAGPTARLAVTSTPQPLPPPLPGVDDSRLEWRLINDDTAGEPTLVASSGLAVPGTDLLVTGTNMVAGETVEMRVNDTPVGEATVDPAGVFEWVVTVDPAVFGTDDSGYDFIVAHLGDGRSAMTWVSTPGPVPNPADINGDGVVNVQDLTAVILAWGLCDDGAPCPADVNGDGVVNVQDLTAVILAWG